MRKMIALEFLSLDGVMQAPGGPDEDVSGGFAFGGWTAPFFDDIAGKIMAKQMKEPFCLLLGRLTYETFASYWPHHADDWKGINEAQKIVVSKTEKKYAWNNTLCIYKNIVERVKKLKEEEGPDLQIYGSGNFIQTLLKNDLVDE